MRHTCHATPVSLWGCGQCPHYALHMIRHTSIRKRMNGSDNELAFSHKSFGNHPIVASLTRHVQGSKKVRCLLFGSSLTEKVWQADYFALTFTPPLKALSWNMKYVGLSPFGISKYSVPTTAIPGFTLFKNKEWAE